VEFAADAIRANMCGSGPVVASWPEQDLDPVAAFLTTLAVLYGFAARRRSGDAGLCAFVIQRISEPVGALATVGQHPLRLWQIAQQGGRTFIDLPLKALPMAVLRRKPKAKIQIHSGGQGVLRVRGESLNDL
jgi:hypothetical protein